MLVHVVGGENPREKTLPLENFARAIESNTNEAEEGLLSGATIMLTHVVSGQSLG